MKRFVLDGETIEALPGDTILSAARRCGREIPSLCDDERLAPAGDCRLCLVDVEGDGDAARHLTACTTPVQDGMVVRSQGAALDTFRRQDLQWMAAHVSPSAYAAWPDKRLHRLLAAHGIAPGGPERGPDDDHADTSHPSLRVDMSQCVACFRCVRICDEVQGQSVWNVLERGDALHIVPGTAASLADSDCVGCGACADTCPTAAITDRLPDSTDAASAAVESWTRTTCPYCGVGCELEAGVAAGRIVRTRPVLDAPVSKGHLCVKGRYAFGYNHAADRALHPLLRERGEWRQATWDEALARVAAEFSRIRERHGASAIGVLGSARATNEDNYVLQKFARVVLGTNNVDCCARVCHTPTAAAMKAMLGTGAATNGFDDIECAHAFLVAGANPTENHPIVGARLRQRVRSGAARLVLVDPRATELAPLAAVHLRPRPGTDIPLFHAMAHVILAEGLADEAFLASRVREVDEFRRFVEAWTPERAAALCGVDAGDIREAARVYAGGRPSMAIHGLGLTEHTQGTETVMALVNLALLTGNLGRPGSGINPLRGQNNVQGAAQMGCDPAILTGSTAIDEGRLRFEDAWGTVLPRDRGLDLLSMMDAAAAGRLKALWIVGYDILPTLANLPATLEALSKLECVVVQDIFPTETSARFAHVFLPAASNFEKDGTFMNAERRVQRVRKVVDAPGEALPDWRIACRLADAMGHGDAFRYASPEEIWNEIRVVWPAAAGITYERIDRGGLQWPCRDESDPGTRILHADSFARGPTAALARIDHVPTPETTDADFPFVLVTGRTLAQFNAGTMTMRTANVQLRPTDTLEMHADDAAALGLRDGQRVKVRSRYGAATLPLEVSDRVQRGQLFATFHDARSAVNRVTSPHRDRIVHAPEYKVTAVAVEPLRGRRKTLPG